MDIAGSIGTDVNGASTSNDIHTFIFLRPEEAMKESGESLSYSKIIILF